jgi:hypothetical protein
VPADQAAPNTPRDAPPPAGVLQRPVVQRQALHVAAVASLRLGLGLQEGAHSCAITS